MDMLYKIIDDIIIFEDGSILISGNKEEVFSKSKLLKEHDIEIPKILEFSNKVIIEKNIKLGYYDDIKDLIKAVYRNV
jgi:ABC-type branched-subunit amino acid transport system ATPase component